MGVRNLSGATVARSRSIAASIFALAIVGSLFLAAPASAGSTLYVDQNTPNCSNTGGGTQSNPFCSIGAAAKAATAGTTVLVASGNYVEHVTITNSGTQAAPIVFQPASGANVTLGGQIHAFTVTARWITVTGFNVTNTTGYGIYLKGSSNITLTNNHVAFSGRPVNGSTEQGIYLVNTTNSLIAGNTTDHNSDTGIYLTTGATGNEIRGNHSFANARQYTRAATGIDVRAPGNTVHRNIANDNEDSGIQLYNGATGTVVSDNVSYNNGDHGIDVLNSTGVAVVSNSVYKNTTAGINFEGTKGTSASSGATAANNISVDNGLTSTTTKGNIRVDANSLLGTTLNYDLVWLNTTSTTAVIMTWGTKTYTSLSAFTQASSQETQGLQANPQWNAPGSGDFTLRPGSPAIDSANSAAPSEPATDIEGNPRVDDPGTQNIGVGPRTYDDRGAYEYRPDSPPAAALSVSPTSGTAPLEVTADASASTDPDSSTPISTYDFDFGDGTAATGPQAAATANHTYATPGTYTVTVTVADTGGKSSQATAAVTVNASDNPPSAAVTVSPTAGQAPLDVTADASGSTDPDATPISTYAFDFGDGAGTGVQTAATASHTYAAAGTYTVTVTVTDTGGLSSNATANVTVSPPDNPPAAALSVTPSSGSAPLAVTADASASTDTDASPIASYRFDFGDNTVVGPQADATANHTYSTPGTYMVIVTVVDTAGQSAQASSQVSVAVAAGTNLIGNPGFETGASGWNNNGRAGVTVTQIIGGRSGSYSAQLANTTTSTLADCTLNDSPNWVKTTQAGTYQASLWARADTAGAALKLRIREYNGSTNVGSLIVTMTLSTSWQQIKLNYVPQAPGSSNLDYTAYITNAPPGTCFYADDAAVTVS